MASAAGVEMVAEWVAGDEITSIVDAVLTHHCDLLIVGLRRHPGLLDRLISKTAQTLTERAPCSVLGVR
jgi:nucleotide-binding universal stress UspA family protein